MAQVGPGRPKGSYTTQQHQEISLFDDAPARSESSLSASRATPAKAHIDAFPPQVEPSKNEPEIIPAPAGDGGLFALPRQGLQLESDWLELRSRALKPKHVSELVTTERDRDEFLHGAMLLRFHGPRARAGFQPQPQQLLVVDMLAAGHKRNAELLPRRSSKSTSAIAVGLGRAAKREDYRVGILTLTSGKAGRSRFLKDVAPPIERLYPDKAERPLKLIKIAGMEGVSFADHGGGTMTWLSTLDDIRGEAFDMLMLDEGGEPNDPEAVVETLGAALPTLDTRPGAQLVVLGTAGRYRDGNLLWDALELGRGGLGGILEYGFPDDTTDEELEAWEPTEEHPEGHVRELIELSHPGVNTLTTLESIRTNYVTMTKNGADTESFAREYGGIFGELGLTRGIFDLDKWALGGTGADLPTPPERFALTMVAHPDQFSACLLAAWRDDDGKAVALLLEHKQGVEWLAAVAKTYAHDFATPLVYDTGAQVILLTVEKLQRARPRPRFQPMAYMDVKKAAALVVDEVKRGNVVHYRQPELTDAIKTAIKRKTGVNGWALGRPLPTPDNPNPDIIAAEAFSLALLAYDEGKPKQQRRKPVVRT